MTQVDLKQLPLNMQKATIEHVVHRSLQQPQTADQAALQDEATSLVRDVLKEVRREIFCPTSYSTRVQLMKIVLSASLRKGSVAGDSDEWEEFRLAWERTADEMQQVAHTGKPELEVIDVEADGE